MKPRHIITLLIIITIITISIIYNTLPRLQLNGNQNIVMSYREEYDDPGVIVKNATGNYMSRIKVDSNLDSKVLGTYYIDYSLKLGGRTLKTRRNIRIIDDVNPVIKLKGDQIIELSKNKQYEDPGYIAYDEYDGDLTEKVEVIGNIDEKNYGEYILTYKVKDKSNNTTEVNRIIKVVDETAPKIECKTEVSEFKKGTTEIIDCTAIDNYDGDITKKIEIKGEYDINTPGTYKIKYKVTDDAGNETEKEHTIIIY